MSTAIATSLHPTETQQVCQYDDVQAQVQWGQTEEHRHNTEVLQGSEEEVRGERSRGERGDRGAVGDAEEGIRGVSRGGA